MSLINTFEDCVVQRILTDDTIILRVYSGITKKFYQGTLSIHQWDEITDGHMGYCFVVNENNTIVKKKISNVKQLEKALFPNIPSTSMLGELDLDKNFFPYRFVIDREKIKNTLTIKVGYGETWDDLKYLADLKLKLLSINDQIDSHFSQIKKESKKSDNVNISDRLFDSIKKSLQIIYNLQAQKNMFNPYINNVRQNMNSDFYYRKYMDN